MRPRKNQNPKSDSRDYFPPRILLLPIDSRPVTSILPAQIARIAGVRVLTPPRQLLGTLNRPADFESIVEWTEKHSSSVDIIDVSIDMLAYGGLVQSRVIDVPLRKAEARVRILDKLHQKFPDLKIYAFNTILRDSITVRDRKTYEKWKNQNERDPNSWPPEFLAARKRNHAINRMAVEMASQGVIHTLLLTKEDTAEGSPFQDEFDVLKNSVKTCSNGRVFIAAGTDESASLMIARAVCVAAGVNPKFKLLNPENPFLDTIPRYENQKFRKTLTSQVQMLGGKFVDKKADAAIYIHGCRMESDWFLAQVEKKRIQRTKNVSEKIPKTDVPLGVLDVAVVNGSDAEWVERRIRNGEFHRIAAYSAWNTAANSSGTLLSQLAVIVAALKINRNAFSKHSTVSAYLECLFNRLADDYVYQTQVRGRLVETVHDPLRQFKEKRIQAILDEKIRSRFEALFNCEFKDKQMLLPDMRRTVELTDVSIRSARLPWNRLFEADVKTQATIKRILE